MSAGSLEAGYSALDVWRAVEASGLPATQRLLVLAVARVANGTRGECYAGAETLAAASGFAVRTLERHMAPLLAAGVLWSPTAAAARGEVNNRKGSGPRGAHRYRVRVEWVHRVLGELAARLARARAEREARRAAEWAEAEADLEVHPDPELEVEVEPDPDNLSGSTPTTDRGPAPTPIDDRGDPDRRSGDQKVDLTKSDPPCSPPTGPLPPDPPPRAEGGGPEERTGPVDPVAWVAARAWADLGEAAARGEDPEPVVRAWELRPRPLIDRLAAEARRGRGPWRWAPEGLRRHTIAQGLLRAAARYRGGERPAVQLALPDPAPAPVFDDLAELAVELAAEAEAPAVPADVPAARPAPAPPVDPLEAARRELEAAVAAVRVAGDGPGRREAEAAVERARARHRAALGEVRARRVPRETDLVG